MLSGKEPSYGLGGLYITTVAFSLIFLLIEYREARTLIRDDYSWEVRSTSC